jgi:hypothetical protein
VLHANSIESCDDLIAASSIDGELKLSESLREQS